MSDDKAPEDGIQIKRRIHPGRLLGKGAMGRVVDGFAADLGQCLAIKILLPDYADDPEVRARFEEEAAIMASIDHPGNLPVYGTSTDAEGNLCYVMKKVEGQTLGELIDERGSQVGNLPVRQRLLSILLDACETVGYAHENGIVHRDLKPANILVDRHDSVFVIDWGLARRGAPGSCESTETRTLPGVIMGSPGYMSPEQAEGKGASAGPATDVFGLGVMLYEILTGKRPFESKGSRAEMMETIHKDPASPRKTNILIPRALSGVCMKALNKHPDQRYRHAGELANDLRAFLEGRPVSAVRPSLLGKIYYASRRNPLRASITGALILSAIVLAVFIGAQVWIDHRLAGKAYDYLEILDEDLEELIQESNVLHARLDSQSISPQERALVESALHRTYTRWALGEVEAMHLLSSVAALRFIRKDPQLNDRACERLFSVIDTSLKWDQPAFVDAIIETILERHDEKRLKGHFSDSDIIRILQAAEEARRRTNLPESP